MRGRPFAPYLISSSFNLRCKWFPFKSTPISTPPPVAGLLPQKGECATCNEFGPQVGLTLFAFPQSIDIKAFLQYLNPSNWLEDGVNLKMIAVVILEGLIFILILYVIIMIVTKCLIPLIRCSLYVPKPFHRGCSKV